MKLKISKRAKTLTDCPVGLFILAESGTLCLKTEYGDNKGGLDCYVVLTGEVLSCQGKTCTEEGCNQIMVYPVRII